MKKFQYQIVRYLHDRVTSEFVNVGIIVYQPESNFLSGKFVSKYSRISQFFLDINGQHLINSLKGFNRQLEITKEQLNSLFNNYSSLDEITNSILPKDDSSLYCTEVLFGVDISPKIALEDLFDRVVNKYIHETDKEHYDDKEVWTKIYKKYFDVNKITDKLTSHTIKTNNDEINFDKAWKNGVWNCYQTLSFDLKANDSIKNKVYKWSGIVNEIRRSKQEMNLFFLTLNPNKDEKIIHFINNTLESSDNKMKIKVIDETHAENFVTDVKNQILKLK